MSDIKGKAARLGKKKKKKYYEFFLPERFK